MKKGRPVGSRAVVVACRDHTVASRRFGVADSAAAGVIVTRKEELAAARAINRELMDRLNRLGARDSETR